MVEELDGDVLAPEQVDERPQRMGGVSGLETAAHGAFAASGQDRPVPARTCGEIVEVVDRAPLLTAAQLRRGDRPREPVIALRAPGEDQQMLAGGIGVTPLWCGQVQGELRSEHRLQRALHEAGHLGEARGAVEAVVVGEGQSGQPEAVGLGEEFFRGGGAVEERVRRMGVQLGIGDRVFGSGRGDGGRARAATAHRSGVRPLPSRLGAGRRRG